jgi:hypothetical protein
METRSQVTQYASFTGIIDEKTGGAFAPQTYYHIEEIKNYLDLTFRVSEPAYLLFETETDFNNKNAHFCFIKNERANISTKKYQNISAFYKGITLAQKYERKFLVDFNEKRHTAPVENLKYGEYLKDIDVEALACLDGGLKNYGLELVIDEDYGRLHYCGYYYKWQVKAEKALMANKNTFKQVRGCGTGIVLDFDYSNGLALFSGDKKLGFQNKYGFIVCDLFDHVFSDKELRDNGIENNNPAIKYVENDGKVFKIEFVGNFVRELSQYPSLFLENPTVKDYIKNHCKTELPIPADLEERYYTKIDKLLFEDRTYESLEDEQLIRHVLEVIPFLLTNEDLTDKIKAHEELFGIIYSSSLVLEELAPLVKDKELIPIEQNKKWGFGTTAPFPKVIVPCEYDEVSKPKDGVYFVKINGEWKEISIEDYL